MVHDIVVDHRGALLPKGASLGIREQYYVLQTLAENGVRCLSAAHVARHAARHGGPRLPVRYEPGGSDRSIIFPGHEQSVAASWMHAGMEEYLRALRAAIDDDRELVRTVHAELTASPRPFFLRNLADMLLPMIGVRFPLAPATFADIPVPDRALSVSEVAAMFERALATRNEPLFRLALQQAGRSHLPRPVSRLLRETYWQLAANTPRRSLTTVLSRGIARLRS